jgi:hypothetical protein
LVISLKDGNRDFGTIMWLSVGVGMCSSIAVLVDDAELLALIRFRASLSLV